MTLERNDELRAKFEILYVRNRMLVNRVAEITGLKPFYLEKWRNKYRQLPESYLIKLDEALEYIEASESN